MSAKRSGHMVVRAVCAAGVTLVLAGYNGYQVTLAAQAEGATAEQMRSGARGALLKDGTFEGKARSFGGPMVVSVTVENGYITAIDITSTSDNSPYVDNATAKVVPEILSAQSWDVDACSGATFSSKGIMNSVNNALVSAGAAEGEATATNMTSRTGSHSTAELKRMAQTQAESEATPWYELTFDDLLGTNTENTTSEQGYTMSQQSTGTK